MLIEHPAPGAGARRPRGDSGDTKARARFQTEATRKKKINRKKKNYKQNLKQMKEDVEKLLSQGSEMKQ